MVSATRSTRLCAFCDPAGGVTPPSCCSDSRTDLSQCSQWGHPLAATIRPTTTVATNVPGSAQSTGAASGTAGTNSATVTGAAASAISTGAKSGNGASRSSTASGAGATSGSSVGANMAPDGQQLVSADDKVFSTKQLAGIIAGCIVGAALLGALLALLCMRRRGENGDAERTRSTATLPTRATSSVPGSRARRRWSSRPSSVDFDGCQVRRRRCSWCRNACRWWSCYRCSQGSRLDRRATQQRHER